MHVSVKRKSLLMACTIRCHNNFEYVLNVFSGINIVSYSMKPHLQSYFYSHLVFSSTESYCKDSTLLKCENKQRVQNAAYTRVYLGFARPARNLLNYLTGISCLQRCAKREMHKISHDKINERDDQRPRYKMMAAICCRNRQSWSYCLELATTSCLQFINNYQSSSISSRHVVTCMHMHGQFCMTNKFYSGYFGLY